MSNIPVMASTKGTLKPEQDILGAPFGHRGDIVAEELGVDVHLGLSQQEATRRLRKYGLNELAEEIAEPWWRILLRQFSSIVIWLLLAAMVVAWFTNGLSEAAAIFIVLLINACIGFIVEWRAGNALDALRDQTHTHARVMRDGGEMVIDSTQVVIGDIVGLAAGDRVPADARLLEAANLQVDESALTGESFPGMKSIDSVSLASVLTERGSMLYMSTMVVSGRCVAIVTATGAQTEIGHIGRLIAKTGSEKTPLERRLESLGRTLVYLVFAIGTAVFVLGWLRGDNPALMLEVSISLAVAAVPEALPAMTTLVLALGVLRMAQRKAIVRKLSAVETLGSATVICSDKTGTLTENRMSVGKIRLSDGQEPRIKNASTPDDLLLRLLRASVLCNDASLNAASSTGNIVGDPTETSLLIAASNFRMNAEAERSKFDRIREEPFDPKTKRMIVTLRRKSDGTYMTITKGAPAVVLEMCAGFADQGEMCPALGDKIRARFLSVNDEMAGHGLRVLAFAEKRLEDPLDETTNGYTFLGFAGMSDKARDGAAEAIHAARRAGVRTVMLTGDQAITAKAIAKDLGLSDDGDVFAMHAREMVGLDDASLAAAAARAHVFARVSPEDKLRIVEVLQKAGEIVAVTGDGINDAPALKKANIGIAMGLRGTEVAKEAADVILIDDNFLTIIAAIEGGRTIYSNIIKFVHLMFSKNLAEVLVIFAAMIAGLPLPLLPLQILWLNLVTDVFPAFALAVEPSSGETMKRRPRPPGQTILSRRFLTLIGWQGVMLAAISILTYVWALNAYGEGPHARTMALLSIVGVQLGHMFNCRSRTRSVFRGFFTNPYIFVAAGLMIGLQTLALCVTPIARVLELTLPNPLDIGVVVGCCFLPILVVEFTKAINHK